MTAEQQVKLLCILVHAAEDRQSEERQRGDDGKYLPERPLYQVLSDVLADVGMCVALSDHILPRFETKA